jgi:hypothetical protein
MGVSGGVAVIGVRAFAKSQYIGKRAITVVTMRTDHVTTLRVTVIPIGPVRGLAPAVVVIA